MNGCACGADPYGQGLFVAQANGQTRTELDLLVVGLGPAGVACALQAQRDGLELLALGDEPVGGLLRAARRLDNLPAEPGISGRQLAARMAEQMEEKDIPVSEGRVACLERAGEGFEAQLSDGRKFRARTVCLACGTRPRVWPLETQARWLHRDARSLPANLNQVDTTLIGGGEAVLDTALTVVDRGGQARVLTRGPRLRAAGRLIFEAERAGVEVVLKAPVDRARFDQGQWTLSTAAGTDYTAQELVVCIGREAQTELALELGGQALDGQIEQQDCPGLFMAGDVIRGRERYVATAMGDGQRAALLAAASLKKEANR